MSKGSAHVISCEGGKTLSFDYSEWSDKMRIHLATTLLASCVRDGKWTLKDQQGNVLQTLAFAAGDKAADLDRATSGIALGR